MAINPLLDTTTSHVWLVHFENAEPVVRRYQTSVDMWRVLNEHVAALAAEPVND